MRALFVLSLELLAYGLASLALWDIYHPIGILGAGASCWMFAQGLDK